ncbi:hypothetical protein HDV62DRAFT_365420 [Trichoderma sp. SZMC 28011]
MGYCFSALRSCCAGLRWFGCTAVVIAAALSGRFVQGEYTSCVYWQAAVIPIPWKSFHLTRWRFEFMYRGVKEKK